MMAFFDLQNWSLENEVFNIIVCGDKTPSSDEIDKAFFGYPCFIIKPTEIMPLKTCLEWITSCMFTSTRHAFNKQMVDFELVKGMNHIVAQGCMEIVDVNILVA